MSLVRGHAWDVLKLFASFLNIYNLLVSEFSMKAPIQKVCYPKVGTFIDGGRLELVSVIGTGGYGNVYKAVDNKTRSHYAVKCLFRPHNHNESHIRETTLHRRASAHPGVVTLLRVIEDNLFMYLVMDYAPDRDLFTQILRKCRYLGNDTLIKSTLLQILDVVEHCHSLGIYHRDLKPENFVCFDDGVRVALTDFGLATTEKTSGEFQTGSVYHMSPECQAAELSFGGVYSPQSCDIWSLGIIFLNIVTGRNPWNCAKWEDASFYSYRQNPYNQLPNVLPISPELNNILITMLSMEWRARPSISEIRALIRQIPTFYSQDVIFDGHVAKCLWEDDPYRGPAARNVNLEDAYFSYGTHYRNTGNNLRTRSIRENFLLSGEDDSGSQTSSTICEPPLSHFDSTSCALSSMRRSSFIPSLEKRLISRPKSSFGSFFGGIHHLFRLCSSSGRKPD